MDPWLTDEIKELLFTPCLSASVAVGRRLDNRRNMGQEIDERALTESFVDSLDTSSSMNIWGNIIELLRDLSIYFNVNVRKSTKENITGADIGFVINRSVYRSNSSSQANYASLVQCKKIDSKGNIIDFFHQVGGNGPKQSTLMLDITPSSFYFIFTPPSLVHTYCSLEPIGFVQVRAGCSSAVWNYGSFSFSHYSPQILSLREKAEAVGILVVPALAVEAQRNHSKDIDLMSLLPNCIPLWYWFGELLIPGFIGDRRSETIAIASNVWDKKNLKEDKFGVRYSVGLRIGKE